MSKEKKQTITQSLTACGSYLFMPVVGGVFKQPFVSMQNFQAGNPHLSFAGSVKAMYQNKTPLACVKTAYNGYTAHLLKVLPSSFIGSAAYNFQDNNTAAKILAGALGETLTGAYQETLEFKKNSGKATGNASLLKQGATIIPSCFLRNSVYWYGIHYTTHVSRMMQAEYENPAVTFSVKSAMALGFAAISTPMHVMACQAYKTNTPNPLTVSKNIITQSGVKGFFAPLKARMGMGGISILFVSLSQDYLNSHQARLEAENNQTQRGR